MAGLTQVLGSPYGAVVVGLFVLGVELAVKAVIDRGKTADPAYSNSASNVNGDLTQTIDARRSVTIHQQRVVNHFQSAPLHGRGASDAPALTDDETVGRLVVGGVLVLLAGAFTTTMLAQHGQLVVNVLVGLAIGTALAGLHLWGTHRRSPVPVGPWALLTVLAAGTVVVVSTRLLGGGFGGVDLAVVAEEVRGLSLWDAVLQVAHHGVYVSAFFLLKFFGVLIAVIVTLSLITRLVAMTVALTALDSGRVCGWHVWVVERLYPTDGVLATAAWGAVALAVSYLLASGTAHQWLMMLSTGAP